MLPVGLANTRISTGYYAENLPDLWLQFTELVTPTSTKGKFTQETGCP